MQTSREHSSQDIQYDVRLRSCLSGLLNRERNRVQLQKHTDWSGGHPAVLGMPTRQKVELPYNTTQTSICMPAVTSAVSDGG